MKKKLVIIEDNRDIRILLEEILTSNGFEVFVAENGYVGIQLIIEIEPDLVLCDIMMPELDGYEVLKTVRKSANIANTPFIFLTAKIEKTDIRNGMQLGADDYLTKPFEEQELINSINSRLERTKKLNEEIERKVQQLKNNMSAVYSHEVNTPLNGIMGLSDVLLKYYKTSLPPNVVEMINYIKEAGARLFRTTSNLILYADLQKYTKETYQQKFSNCIFPDYSEPLLDSILDFTKPYNREDDLSIDFQNANLKISETDLTKMITEVLDNALKYSDRGTPIFISSKLNDDYISFKISDFGYGFKKEWMEQIGAFVQFDRNIKEQQGMGLGLYFVQKLAEFNNVTFQITENIPTGTVVTFKIPIAE